MSTGSTPASGTTAGRWVGNEICRVNGCKSTNVRCRPSWQVCFFNLPALDPEMGSVTSLQTNQPLQGSTPASDTTAGRWVGSEMGKCCSQHANVRCRPNWQVCFFNLPALDPGMGSVTFLQTNQPLLDRHLPAIQLLAGGSVTRCVGQTGVNLPTFVPD